MSGLHVVLGAGGGAGAAVVRALAARGSAVRAVTGSGAGPAVGEGVESVRADATDPAATRAACAGAHVVYHSVNVPYTEWGATLRFRRYSTSHVDDESLSSRKPWHYDLRCPYLFLSL